MSRLNWLPRAIAHRGLHDAARGVIENTSSAFEAALRAGYAFELDLQETADGEAAVFHDDTLDRLTEESGPVLARTAQELRCVRFKQTGDRMQTLPELLEQTAGRAPMLIEVKSRWNRRGPFEKRIGDTLASYKGPAAVMSFDPNCVAAFKSQHPGLARGMVATRFHDEHEWRHASTLRRFAMTHLLHAFMVRPDFIAYDVRELPTLATRAARRLFRLPLMAWTVRDEAQRKIADVWADGMIFERLRP